MTLIIFILILSVLVLVHEFGHFIVAKKLGIRVEEFGLGIPPRIFGKKFGETLYSLNWLPFGGFVKVTGEDPEESSAALTDPRSFASRTPGQRAAVLVAGVVMNMLLAAALFYIVLMSNGYRTQYIPMIFDHQFKLGSSETLGAVVTGMLDGSSAKTAGVQLGEAILEIDSLPITDVYSLRDSLKGKLGQDVTVKLQDVRVEYDGAVRTVTMKPQADDNGNVVLGVYVTKAVSLGYTQPWEKVFAGFLHSYNVLDFSVKSFGSLIGLSYSEKSMAPVSQSVAGPVGIYQLVGGLLTYGGSKVVYRILDFVALMSVSLAFINIMPFPALDGGRLLFVIIEKIKGSPVSPKVESVLHKWGFMFLLLLLVLVTIKDVAR
jgi:regulator of sigma E protease